MDTGTVQCSDAENIMQPWQVWRTLACSWHRLAEAGSLRLVAGCSLLHGQKGCCPADSLQIRHLGACSAHVHML